MADHELPLVVDARADPRRPGAQTPNLALTSRARADQSPCANRGVSFRIARPSPLTLVPTLGSAQLAIGEAVVLATRSTYAQSLGTDQACRRAPSGRPPQARQP